MQKTAQTKKRSSLVDAIVSSLKKTEILSDTVSRKSFTEAQIQTSLFAHLQKKLPYILGKHFNYSQKKVEKIVEKDFKFEKKRTTTVPSFNVFETNHHPDAVLEINKGLRIAIELKAGDTGQDIRAGIGQSLVYSTQFNFTIYLFVDTTPGYDIEGSVTGKKEKALINSLWKNYNVKFIVV